MIVKSLELKNFRNYSYVNIDFDGKTNILYGDNAQGKTNILEALYVSGTTKSHKGSKDREMIRFENEESHLRTVIEKNEIEYCIDIHLKKMGNKGVAINKIPIKRAAELLGIVNIVFFSPEDLDIIKRGPTERRHFMDMELCQLDSIYYHNLVQYNKVLKQRNQLLKDIYFKPGLKLTLDVWDEQLASFGEKIMKRRRTFIEEINQKISDIHSSISGEREHLVLSYEPGCDENNLLNDLKKSRDKDIKRGQTNYGPHRDDICFEINDNDIRKYGSQGQQRTAALSLKLAEIEIVKDITGDTPILLLDDVMSELDSHRQNYLLESIGDIQTIVTCTGLDEFIKNRFDMNRVYFVENGEVSLQKSGGFDEH